METQTFEKPTKITFKTFSEEFMSNYVCTELKVKSRNTYENYLKQGIVDFFGQYLVKRITSAQINVFFTEQKKAKAGSLVEKVCFT